MSPCELFAKAKKLRKSLLLVSRQFNREYSERCTSQQALQLKDHSDYPAFVCVRDKAVCWSVSWCDDVETFEEFVRDNVHEFVTLRSMNLKLYLQTDDITSVSRLCSDTRMRKTLERLMAIEKVDSLEVYAITRSWHYRKAAERRRMLARWQRSRKQPIEILNPAAEIDEAGSECEGSDSEEDPAAADDDEDIDDIDHKKDDDDRNESDTPDYEDSDESDQGNEGSRGSKDGAEDEGGANEDAECNDDTSDDDVANDSGSRQATSFFDFFGLPREIRDLIYGQPEMLEDVTLDQPTDGRSCIHDYISAVKPRDSVLLVNQQFHSEYSESLVDRLEITVSSCLYRIGPVDLRRKCLQVPHKAVEEASFLNIHACNWRTTDSTMVCTDLCYLQLRIEDVCSQMPNLRSVKIELVTPKSNIELVGLRNDIDKFLITDNKLDVVRVFSPVGTDLKSGSQLEWTYGNG